MSFIEILLPDINHQAAVITEQHTSEADYPAENLSYGSKSTIRRLATPIVSGQSSVYWDLGSSNTRAAEFFAIARADLLQAQNVTQISYQTSPDDITYTPIHTINNIQTQTLKGPYQQDYFATISGATAQRYHRVRFTVTGSSTLDCSKTIFGTRFQFGGRGPRYPYAAGFEDERRGFAADAGTVFKTTTGKRRRVYQFQWLVDNATRELFEETVGRVRDDYPVFLLERDTAGLNHRPLQGYELIYAWIDSYRITSRDWRDLNEIAIRFIEDIA